MVRNTSKFEFKWFRDRDPLPPPDKWLVWQFLYTTNIKLVITQTKEPRDSLANTCIYYNFKDCFWMARELLDYCRQQNKWLPKPDKPELKIENIQSFKWLNNFFAIKSQKFIHNQNQLIEYCFWRVRTGETRTMYFPVLLFSAIRACLCRLWKWCHRSGQCWEGGPGTASIELWSSTCCGGSRSFWRYGRICSSTLSTFCLVASLSIVDISLILVICYLLFVTRYLFLATRYSLLAAFITFFARSAKAADTGELSLSEMGAPSSPDSQMPCTSGISPKRGTPALSASFFPPSRPKI